MPDTSPTIRLPTLSELGQELQRICSAGDIKSLRARLASMVNAPDKTGLDILTDLECKNLLVATAEFAENTDGTPKIQRKVAARMLRVLIDNGAIRFIGAKELVATVVRTSNTEALADLMSKGVELKEMSRLCCVNAAQAADPEVLAMLVGAGVDLNAADTHGNAVIHLIASGTVSFNIPKRQQNRAARVKLMRQKLSNLRDAGVDIDLQDKLGATALLRAIASSNLDLARALVDIGADVERPMRHGVNAIHLAVASCPRDFVDHLFAGRQHLPTLRTLRLTKLQPDTRSLIDLHTKTTPT